MHHQCGRPALPLLGRLRSGSGGRVQELGVLEYGGATSLVSLGGLCLLV
jgi:hypothetical protein